MVSNTTNTEHEASSLTINHAISIFTTPKWPSSRRSHSLSSSSSSSSLSSTTTASSSPPPSPTTLLRRFPSGGVPFSWETIPGIPKKQILKNIDSCRNHNHSYLPLLPPPAKSNLPKKNITSRRDPFLAALVECSKGGNDENKGALGSIRKGTATLFLINNMSCKNSSAVTESLVRTGRRRIAYDVVKKRSG